MDEQKDVTTEEQNVAETTTPETSAAPETTETPAASEESKTEEAPKAEKKEEAKEAAPAAKKEDAKDEKKEDSRDNKRKPFNRRGGGGGRGRGRGGNRRGRERTPSEFKEKVIDLRRVTRVMGGGKRFRFRTTLIIGDEKGRVGVGIGKSVDVVGSINKAKNDAKRNLITIARSKTTIPHEVEAKFSAAKVILKPTREGNGLVAGGAVRVVLALAGIKDISAKCLGRTTNKLTNALATIEALKQLTPVKTTKKEKVEKKEPVNTAA